MQAPKRPVVLRFRFGKGLVKARKESENTARFIAERIALAYAEENWDDAKAVLSDQIRDDVRTELVHMSSLFRRFITGAPGTKNGPSGKLDTVAKGTERPSASLSSMMPSWKPRSERYMMEKRNSKAGISWFDNSRWNARRAYPGKERGYLRRQFNPEGFAAQTLWEEMFGNVSVRIVRNNKDLTQQGKVSLPASRGNHVKVQMARVSVQALGKIDPNMLSAYRSSNPRLAALIYAKDQELGKRLGGISTGRYRTGQGGYRPTLEPFLDFFLTRALPHAVSERIRKGSFGLTSRRRGPS